MALIGNLDIVLKGNTQSLDGSLDRAGAGLQQFRQKVGQQTQAVNASLSNIGTGISGTLQQAFLDPAGAIKTMGGAVTNAILHPIQTAKGLVGGLVGTMQSVGNSIIGTFKGIGTTLFSFIYTPASIVARGLVGLFTVPFGIIGAGIRGLASAWNVLYEGGMAVAGKLAGAFATGIGYIKSAISSLPKVGQFIFNIVAKGFNLITSALSALPKVGSFIFNIVSTGFGFIKTALASLPKATSFFFKIISTGFGSIKTAISALPKVGSFIFNIGVKGLDAVKAGINGIGTALKGIGNLASSGLSGLASSASSAISSLVGVGGAGGAAALGIGAVALPALAGVAALAAFAGGGLYLASQQADVIASMHRTASVLGMTTQAYSALASTAGMSSDQFGAGLEHLERTLAEAAQGGGEASQALARVGLNARNLLQGSPDQQLNQLANAMQRIPSQAERLRLSMQLFGREAGPEFVAALQNGQAGLDQFRERAERFGLVFDNQQAEIVKRSNKVWNDFKLGLQGIGNQLAIALAPIWEWAGKKLGDFFEWLVNKTKIIAPYISQLWDGVAEALDAIGPILKAVFAFGTGPIGLFITYTDDLKGALDSLAPFVKETWQIIKTATSLAWEAVKGIISACVEFVRPLINSFVAQVQEWMGGLASFILGEPINSWASFKDAALRFLITIEFGLQNFSRVAGLTWDMIRLKMLEWTQALAPVLSAVEGFINAVIDAFNTMNAGIARLFNSTINGIISAYNSVADRIGVRRINFSVNVDARQLDHVNLAVGNLDRDIAELRARINDELGAVNSDLAAFINQRLAELHRVAQQAQQAANNVNQQLMNSPINKVDNKAAEKGSAEAYSIMVGQQGDKMYTALNDILRELRAARQLDADQLRELQRRASLAVARM